MPVSVRVIGDFAKARQLAGELEQLSGSEAKEELNTLLGAAAHTRVALEFDEGVDPYGRPWLAPSSRPGGQPLRDTGRLGNSFSYGATATSFRLGTAVKYATIHQYGAVIRPTQAQALRFKVPFAVQVFSRAGAKLKRAKVLSNVVYARKVTIPQRQMVPEEDLGPIWLGDFDVELADFLQAHFRV